MTTCDAQGGGSTAGAELAEISPWPSPSPAISADERLARLEHARRLTRDAGAESDTVLIDTGCAVLGYRSDITRTHTFRPPDADQRRIWTLEQEAQEAAFEAAKPGRTCESVNAAARAVLKRAGLGPGYALPGLPHRTAPATAS